MKRSCFVLLCLFFVLGRSFILQAQDPVSIVANPMNLNYRFQPLDSDPARREAADPVLEYFNGKYYLFASKSGGYWSSPDLAEWTYIPCTTIKTLEGYAPTILVLNGTLYFLTGGEPRIFATTDPDQDHWTELPRAFAYGMTDPSFFKDEDTGKVYIYWGCSDVDPIMGVEVDPAQNFKAIGTPQELIYHRGDQYGWEVPGKENEERRTGWNEGPCMIKYKGKYYLQYAAPGTEYRIYGDGIYVGDTPLGPFTYQEYSPFSFKPGGFIGGTGHGHTFQDKYGNYWHVASMKISVRHMFERRLGLFPVYFTEDGNMYSSPVWSDYPYFIPQAPTDFSNTDLSLRWNVLSYGKNVLASSSLNNRYLPRNAADEQVETWWSAATGDAGEWFQVDLGGVKQVNAIQVNLADQDFTIRANPTSYFNYQYYIEVSDNEETWTRLVDRTQNSKDMPHELIVLDEPVRIRYLRIVNSKSLEGRFSLYDLRVFGNGDGDGALPSAVQGIQANRKNADLRRFQVHWDNQDNTDGYIVHWGVRPDQLNNATMVYTNQLEAGYFNLDSPYYFSVDAFNENGITPGTTVIEGIISYGTPYKGILRSVPGTIEAEDFNEGGPDFGYADLNNSGSSFYRTDAFGISEYRSSRIIFLSGTVTGESTNYTIEVTESGIYTMNCIAASPSTQPGGFYLSFDGNRVEHPTITSVPLGSRSTFHSVTVPGIQLDKGTHVMTFHIEGNVLVDRFIFSKPQLGINPVSALATVNSYPNPFVETLTITIASDTDESCRLTVHGTDGRSFYREEVVLRNGSTTIELGSQLRSLAPGVYFVSIGKNTGTETFKIIKQ